jgi:hypothetical protein
MTVRLVISQDVAALSQSALALASSVLLHGAMVAAVWNYSGVSPNFAGPVLSLAPVQILRLVPNQDAVWVPPNPPLPWDPAAGRGRGDRQPAPETLQVGGAPPDSQLQQALPLPAAAAWTGFHSISSAADLVAAADRNEALDAADPAFLATPRIDIISVPEIALPDAAVPVVNQEAASSGSGGVSASPISETPASAFPLDAAALGPALEPAADPALVRIELPRDSRPPVSVLGESVAGQYPEIANQVQARVVSAIYLQMGLKKSWFLEYWAAQPGPKGGIGRLDAPWPYMMLRPKLEFSPGEKVILVRGVLTAEGQLQGLSLLLPPHWSQKDRLFEVLAYWKFRPASRNGQPVPVEVLLVIPRQAEE